MYVRSLTEHILLLERYKKQAELGIQQLELEVASLTEQSKVTTKQQEKLKVVWLYVIYLLH